jgi:hypothetical protein
MSKGNLEEMMSGISSVEMLVKADGNGIVNWNGSVTVWDPELDNKKGDKERSKGDKRSNHLLPKLRGYVEPEKGNTNINSIDPNKTPPYISFGCLRNAIFKDQAYDCHHLAESFKGDGKSNIFEPMSDFIASMTGLVRGYVIPGQQWKKQSALRVPDFEYILGSGNYEQNTRCGDRDNSSLFSKTTFGDFKCEGHCSINIEELQFISLDSTIDRQAYNTNGSGEGEIIADNITKYIRGLSDDKDLNPKATFGKYAKITKFGREPARASIISECGVLLNDDALTILVDAVINRIRNLKISRTKGVMRVSKDDVTVIYSEDSIGKVNFESGSNTKNTKFVQYYIEVPSKE